MRLTGTFQAEDDCGRPYTLHIYTDFFIPQPKRFGPGRPAAAPAEPATEVRGRDEIRLAGGGTVTLLSRGHYRVNGTGTYLHSTDPTAP
jgi:hypothetical protein